MLPGLLDSVGPQAQPATQPATQPTTSDRPQWTLPSRQEDRMAAASRRRRLGRVTVAGPPERHARSGGDGSGDDSDNDSMCSTASCTR